MPAGWSLHAAVDGRYRESSCRLLPCGPHGCSTICRRESVPWYAGIVMTSGSSCPVNYATQLTFRDHHISRKPIKNMELGGSADTCIGTTRGGRPCLLRNDRMERPG